MLLWPKETDNRASDCPQMNDAVLTLWFMLCSRCWQLEVFKFTIICCTGAVVSYLVRLFYRQEDKLLKILGLKGLLLCVLAAFSVGKGGLGRDWVTVRALWQLFHFFPSYTYLLLTCHTPILHLFFKFGVHLTYFYSFTWVNILTSWAVMLEVWIVQETHIRSSDNDRLMSRWKGQHFHSLFQAKARVLLFSSAKMSPLRRMLWQ